MIISINPQNPQLRLVRRVVEVLKQGGVIGYPTDTIYGIGCDLFNKEAIEKSYKLFFIPDEIDYDEENKVIRNFS